MCRLFGFRSVLPSHVHTSLARAENALGVQSQRHQDGWGVAYYVAGSPHVVKSSAAAYTDRLFQRVSGAVTSNTVIAHVRKATVGELSVLNSHPFQHGRWVFAHNGHVPGFDGLRPMLMDRIVPELRGHVLGDTDSEVIFHLFLSLLSESHDLHAASVPIEHVASALRRARDLVCAESARLGLDEPSLNLLTSNGQVVVATRRGRELHWSIRKNHCSERDTCSHFRPECEREQPSGRVSHFIVSSEPLQGENVWEPVADGAVVGCDVDMRVHRWAS
jgi:glutamine amidotransferase